MDSLQWVIARGNNLNSKFVFSRNCRRPEQINMLWRAKNSETQSAAPDNEVEIVSHQ